MFIVQAVLFIVIGIALNLLANTDAKEYIPMSNLDPVAAMLAYGFGGLALLVFVNVGLYAIFMKTSRRYRLASRASDEMITEALDIGVARIPILILSSFAEEMLFRFGMIPFLAGLIIALGAHHGTRALLAAAVVSSIVFTLVHSQYGDWKQLAQVLLAGFILSGVYLACGSIFVVWIIHLLVNASALAFEPLIQSRTRAMFPEDYADPPEVEGDVDGDAVLGEDVGDGDSGDEGVDLVDDAEGVGDIV